MKFLKQYLLIFIILFSGSVYSQVILQLKDSITREPAPYVTVLDENNNIITASNELGIVVLDEDNKLINTLILESIFYKKKEIISDELTNNSTILLKSKLNVLDNVTITSELQKKYLVLKAYYRIYNLIDDILVSFVDAEVRYILRNKSFKKKVLNYRVFDTISSRQYKQKTPYWIEDLSFKTLLEKANAKYYLVEKEKNRLIDIVGKRSNKIYGTIKKDSNLNHNSDIIITTKEKADNYTIINEEEYSSDEFLTITIKDLKYKHKTVNITITPKMIKLSPDLKGKKEKVHKRETFIQGIDYVSKKEFKKLMKMGYKDTSVSHYSKDFWKNLETFSPLESNIQKQLDRQLKERK